MVVISKGCSTIIVTGHANYAEPGKDIVCSAVSTLVQTLVASIEKLTEDKIAYDMQPGEVAIKFWCLSDPSRALVDAFFVGIEMLANDYPNHVKLTKH